MLHDRFLICLSLSVEGGFREPSSFGPQLASCEYLVRVVIYRSVLDGIGWGAVEELDEDETGVVPTAAG